MKTTQEIKLTTIVSVGELMRVMNLANNAVKGVEDDGMYCYTVLFGENEPFIVAEDLSDNLPEGERAVVVTYSVNNGIPSLIGTDLINY